LLVEAPELVHEDGCVEGKVVLLLGTEWEQLVVLFIINDFVLKISIAQLNYRLLRSANLRKQL